MIGKRHRDLQDREESEYVRRAAYLELMLQRPVDDHLVYRCSYPCQRLQISDGPGLAGMHFVLIDEGNQRRDVYFRELTHSAGWIFLRRRLRTRVKGAGQIMVAAPIALLVQI